MNPLITGVINLMGWSTKYLFFWNEPQIVDPNIFPLDPEPTQVLVPLPGHRYLILWWKLLVVVSPGCTEVSWHVFLKQPWHHMAGKESSFSRARDTCDVVKKDLSLSSLRSKSMHMVMGSFHLDLKLTCGLLLLAQELKFHGVELAGPSKRLQETGATGKHKSNIKRDMVRKVGHVAPWLNMCYYI